MRDQTDTKSAAVLRCSMESTGSPKKSSNQAANQPLFMEKLSKSSGSQPASVLPSRSCTKSILYQVVIVCLCIYIYKLYIYIPTIPPSQTKIVIQNERCRDVSATPGSPFRRPRLGSRRTMARSDAPNRSSHPSAPETARIDASHGHFLSPERSVKIDLWQMLIT